MSIPELDAKLALALTAYDMKQSKRAGYNPHALGLYLDRLHTVRELLEAGLPLRRVLLHAFCDRLCDALLKSIGEAPVQPNERELGAWPFDPDRLREEHEYVVYKSGVNIKKAIES